MNKLLLLCLAGLCPLVLFGQTWGLSTGETSPTYHLEGTIAETYAIEMVLVKSDIGGLVGYYQYLSVGQPIQLVGNLSDGALTLYEMGEDYVPRARFEGTFSGTQITGNWLDQTKAKTLVFALESKEAYAPNYSSTALLFQGGEDQFSISLPEFPDPITSAILWEKKKGNSVFMLVSFDYYSLGTCRPRGMCGCGVEGWYFLVQYDEDTKSGYIRDRYQYTSCFKGTDCDLNIGPELRKSSVIEWTCYDSENEEGMDFLFDANQPQLGFQKQ